MIPEPLDRRLRDDNALQEIELTGRLIIAGSAANALLSAREVDAILFDLDARSEERRVGKECLL